MISIQQNLSSRVEACDKARFRQTICRGQVRDICRKVAAIANEVSAEQQRTKPNEKRIGELRDRMQKLKRGLPAFLFQASFPEGRRKQDKARLTGLYMCDFDHVDESKIKNGKLKNQVIEEYGILLIHITPSGQGLRIVAKADPAAGNIADNQARLARALGLPLDEACKDASRISYAFPEENLIYLNDELFTYENTDFERIYGAAYRSGRSNPTAGAALRPAGTAGLAATPALRTAQPAAPRTEMADNTDNAAAPGTGENPRPAGDAESEELKTGSEEPEFRGVAYSEIIAEWWRQHGGEPACGERNVKLHKLAYCLRYITDKDEALLLRIMPNFGLDGGEMRNLIASACDARMYSNIPDELQRVLKAVGAVDKTKTGEKNDSDEKKREKEKEREEEERRKAERRAESELREERKMDDFLRLFSTLRLPPAMKAVCSGVADNVRIGAVLASLPMFYTLLSRVRFHHFDGAESRLSGMTFVIGPAASGKSFILDLDRLLMEPVRRKDKEGRDREEEYKQAVRAAKNAGEQPKKEKYCIRVVPIQISNTMLAQRMRDASAPDDSEEKLHVYSVEAELATAIRAAKGGNWIEKNDIYCKAFHNEHWGMDYANDQAINGEIQVNYNLVVSGTEDSFDQLITNRNILSGLPTRLMYFPMPHKRYLMLKKDRAVRTAEERQLLSATAEMLYSSPLRSVDARPLTDALYDWCAAIARDAELADDEELDDLRKRTALIGVRAGIVHAILSQTDDAVKAGTPPEISADSIAFARFIADFCLHAQYAKFAARMRARKESVREYSGEREHPLRLTEVYNQLPPEFTLDDFARLRPEAKRDTLRICCHRWTRNGLLYKKENLEKTYRKKVIVL